jgi:hypothetical protein
MATNRRQAIRQPKGSTFFGQNERRVNKMFDPKQAERRVAPRRQATRNLNPRTGPPAAAAKSGLRAGITSGLKTAGKLVGRAATIGLRASGIGTAGLVGRELIDRHFKGKAKAIEQGGGINSPEVEKNRTIPLNVAQHQFKMGLPVGGTRRKKTPLRRGPR